MYVTVEGYILALARVKKYNEEKIIRTYVKYECDYDASLETFSKDIEDITIDDVLYTDEYEVASVFGKFTEGDSVLTEIIRVFDWSVDIE